MYIKSEARRDLPSGPLSDVERHHEDNQVKNHVAHRVEELLNSLQSKNDRGSEKSVRDGPNKPGRPVLLVVLPIKLSLDERIERSDRASLVRDVGNDSAELLCVPQEGDATVHNEEGPALEVETSELSLRYHVQAGQHTGKGARGRQNVHDPVACNGDVGREVDERTQGPDDPGRGVDLV